MMIPENETYPAAASIVRVPEPVNDRRIYARLGRYRRSRIQSDLSSFRLDSGAYADVLLLSGLADVRD